MAQKPGAKSLAETAGVPWTGVWASGHLSRCLWICEKEVIMLFIRS